MQPEELNRWNRKKKELEHLMRDIYRRRGRTHQSLRQKREYSQPARSSLIALGRYEKEELKRAEAELAVLQARRRQAEAQEKRNRILRSSVGIIMGVVLVLFLFSGVYYFATDSIGAGKDFERAITTDTSSMRESGTNFLQMLWQSFSSSDQLSGAAITEVSEAEGETAGETEGEAVVGEEQSSSAPGDAAETQVQELPPKPLVEAHFAADEDAIVRVEENSSWELLGTSLQYAGEDIPQAIDFQPEIVVSTLNITNTSTTSSTPPGRAGAESGAQSGISSQSTPSLSKEHKKEIKITIPHQRQYRPGMYVLSITSRENGIITTTEQAFSWGVLAINTEKSIYLPNENAFMGMAVLDDQGRMVCTVEVVLEITAPNGRTEVLSTANGKIRVSSECEIYGVTNLPDYYTDYKVAGPGTYLMNLTATTPNGIRSLQDTFIVQENVPFDVARHGPTRIYPLVPYRMNFTIIASKDYTGPVWEYVPASFAITPQEEMSIATKRDTTTLSWNVNLKKGETTTISYEFDAPDLSPEFYVLGQLNIGSWQEARSWQIASDQGFQYVAKSVNDVDMFPINESAVLIAYVAREFPFYLQWEIFNTSGSSKQGPVVVTPSGSNITRVAVAPLNDTHFTLGWTNISLGDAQFKIYRFDGTIWQDKVDVDNAIGSSNQDLSIVTTGEGNGNGGKGGDRFFYCYVDDSAANDALLAIYKNSNEQIGTTITIDGTMSPDTSAMNYIHCAAINRTSIVYIENDVQTGDISYAVINGSGTFKVATTALTVADPGATSQVATTVVNTTWGNRYVLAWYNATDRNIVMRINDEDNNAIFSNGPIALNAGDFSKVAIATVNNKSSEGDNFVMLWYNSTDEVIYAQVFNGSGTSLVDAFKVETQPSRHPSLMTAVGKVPVLNYSLCPGYFGVAYTINNSNNSAVIRYYNSTDGKEWEGNCPIPDTTTPSIPDVLPRQNTTYNVSDSILIAANVTDDVEVSRVFVNISEPNGSIKLLELDFRSDNRYNNTFTAPALVGHYNLTFFANDSSRNENRTVTSNFSVTDVVNPSVTTLLPAAKSIFNTSDSIEIGANVTDDVEVSDVRANVTYPNGTLYSQEILSNKAGYLSRYNTSFQIPVMNGVYNITILANDTSNNLNATNTTNFTAFLNCGTLTDSVGMEQDVDSSGTCFITDHDDITLDCAGYNITYATALGGNAVRNINGKGDNVTVKHCKTNQGGTSSSAHGIYFANSELNGVIYNNTITVTTTSSHGIFLDQNVNMTNITENTITTSGAGARGIYFSNAHMQSVTQNRITASSTAQAINLTNSNSSNFTAINITNSGSESALALSESSTGNLFINLNISLEGTSFPFVISNRGGSKSNNTLLYNNSFGLINWTTTNLSTNISLGIGQTIYLQNNLAGLTDDNQALTLNGTASIEITGLDYSSTPQLLKDGVRCDDGDDCNITYDSTGGVLFANVSSFSNYTTTIDDTSPNVTVLLPDLNSIFNTSDSIEIGANVTDDVEVDTVYANITYPDGTINQLTLENRSDFPEKFNASFTIPVLNGAYNVSFFANDTSNNINFTNFTNFTAFLDCGTLTNSVTMDQDVNSVGTCFTLGAPNIYLNCSGYAINYSSVGFNPAYGIKNTGGFDNVIIQHCVITETNTEVSQSSGIVFNGTAENGIIYNNTITTIGSSAGIVIGTSSDPVNITLNTITTSGTSATAIILDDTFQFNVMASNVITVSADSADGIFINTLSSDNNITSNNVTVSGNGAGIRFSPEGSTHQRNLLFNNIVYNLGGGYSIRDESATDRFNSVRYNTSLSQIFWEDYGTLTANISLEPGVTIFLNNNSVGLTDDAQALNLNGTAAIEIYSLPYATLPRLLKDNVRCDDTNACNTSYESLGTGVGILRANLSSFSNYSTNTLPTQPVLLSPANNSTLVTRTPTFIWNNSQDTNNPNLTYNLVVDDNADFSNPEINVTSIAEGTTNTSYTITTQLGLDTLFYWQVGANDTEGYGNFSQVFNFTVESFLAVTLLTNTVAFGEQAVNARLTTSNTSLEGDVQPFELQNDGNLVANISINSSALFSSVSFPSEYYQFRIEENETGSFDTALSNMSYVNMSAISSLAIVLLDWVDVNDDVLVAFNVTVPSDELSGSKSSTVTFSAEG